MAFGLESAIDTLIFDPIKRAKDKKIRQKTRAQDAITSENDRLLNKRDKIDGEVNRLKGKNKLKANIKNAVKESKKTEPVSTLKTLDTSTPVKKIKKDMDKDNE